MRTKILGATTLTPLLPYNEERAGLIVQNDSTSVMYLIFGPAGSAADYSIQLAAGASYTLENPPKDAVNAIWTTANGNAYVTEWDS